MSAGATGAPTPTTSARLPECSKCNPHERRDMRVHFPDIAPLIRATRSYLHAVAFEHSAACPAEPRPVHLKAALNRAVIAKILPAEALSVARAGPTLLRRALRHGGGNTRDDNCNGKSQSDHRNLTLGDGREAAQLARVVDGEHAAEPMVPLFEWQTARPARPHPRGDVRCPALRWRAQSGANNLSHSRLSSPAHCRQAGD
jgi:hypothetical protein